jgi:hypothetical protein
MRIALVLGTWSTRPQSVRSNNNTKIQRCLPLKIREIKKQFGTKDSKIQGEILKPRRGLIQVQKAPREKKNS